MRFHLIIIQTISTAINKGKIKKEEDTTFDDQTYTEYHQSIVRTPVTTTRVTVSEENVTVVVMLNQI